MTVDGVEIKEGVYNYYLDEAEKENGDKEKVDEIAEKSNGKNVKAKMTDKNLFITTSL